MLIIIGGHEDIRGQRRVLQRFVEALGGEGALAVLAVATEDPRKAEALYREAFSPWDLELEFFSLMERSWAREEKTLKRLEACRGFYFTGGDQLRITTLLGGTPAHDIIRRRFREGAVVAGTSAGASAMSGVMIVGGKEMASPALEVIRLSPGLGFLPEAVVDQHFAQRGRMGRLLSAVAQNPGLLGIGIDENTALVIEGDEAQAVGEGTVVVVDGRTTQLSNVSELSPEEPLTLWGITLHVLSEGYGFRLDTRTPREGTL
ncbi:MAG: cyanophycinase [Bacillota bacterium]|nr:cyanophycinase [Bacillota bacterium]